MSNSIAPSATLLTVSGQTEENYPFAEVAYRIAKQKVGKNSLTTEAHKLNREKLISAVCADFRAHFAAIYGKKDRLPTEIYEKVVKAVDEFVMRMINSITPLNAIQWKKSFHWKEKQDRVDERVTVIGDNALSLKEQHFGINLYLGQAERRLKDLMAKPTPDLDAETNVKDRIKRLTITKNFIEAEMKHQESLTTS